MENEDFLKWSRLVHQTAFSYLKYRDYYWALEFLKKSSLSLMSSSDAWYDGDLELTGWHLYIQVPMELKKKFDEYLEEDIKEAYGEALGSDNYLRDIHVEIKKIEDSDFYFNFKDQVASLSRKFDYDVVLSFAGEDRQYVEQVANNLLYSNIRVFYDKFSQVDTWGKDLYIHFDDIYRKKARYCVMFLSENYANKLWTSHERRSAQARAFEEKREYILPVRFDNTEIPGITSTIGYINANEFTPKELANRIKEKLKNGE